MAETYGMSYADVVHAKEAHPRTPSVRHSIEERAKRPLENGSIEWIRLYNRQDRERRAAEGRLQEAKQEVRKETRQEIDVVRPLSLSDVRSPAGLSHYIDRSGDEAMRILEEAIGLESTWKILLLTGAHTSIEFGKGLADILKIGEGTAEWSMALDRKDLSGSEKALAMTKGIGIDGLRALGIVLPAISKLGPFLKNLKIPENTTGVTTPERPKMGDYRAFSGQRGAVGERVKPEVKAAPEKQWSIIEYENTRPQKVAEIIKGEQEIITNPEKNLEELTKKLTLSSDKLEREMVEKQVNGWVDVRLWNIDNMLDYTTRCRKWLPESEWLNGEKEIRKRTIVAFDKLTEHIDRIEKLKWVHISDDNAVLREKILSRIK